MAKTNTNIVKMEDFDLNTKNTYYPVPQKSFVTAKPFSKLSNLQVSETSLEPSVPKEKIVQSSPIKTIMTDKILKRILKKNEDISKSNKIKSTPKSTLSLINEKLNATSFTPNLNQMTILHTPTSQLQIFENKAKASEKELIAFIQKLMDQAKKEQEHQREQTDSSPIFYANSSPQVIPVKLRPIFSTNLPSSNVTNHSTNLDYNHIWNTSSIISTSRNLLKQDQTEATIIATDQTTTSATKYQQIEGSAVFSPIPIESFPQLNLEDFVTPTSLDIDPVNFKTNELKETISDAPILPFRTTLRTSTTTTTTQKPTTTTDGSPAGVITRLLSEAAAPIAGLSAATLAYSAAAMLPVWLPLALGRRKRSEPLDLLSLELSQSLHQAHSKDRSM